MPGRMFAHILVCVCSCESVRSRQRFVTVALLIFCDDKDPLWCLV